MDTQPAQPTFGALPPPEIDAGPDPFATLIGVDARVLRLVRLPDGGVELQVGTVKPLQLDRFQAAAFVLAVAEIGAGEGRA